MDLIALLSDLGHTIYGSYTAPGDVIIATLLGMARVTSDPLSTGRTESGLARPISGL